MPSILTINGGSSSIKFAVFSAPTLQRTLAGRIERIGEEGTTLVATRPDGGPESRQPFATRDHASAAELLVERLDADYGIRSPAALA